MICFAWCVLIWSRRKNTLAWNGLVELKSKMQFWLNASSLIMVSLKPSHSKPKLHNLFCIYRVEKLVISIFKRLPTFIQVAVYKSRQQRREKRLLIYKHYLIIGYLVKVSTNFAYVTGLYPCLTKICTIFSKFHANIVDIYMQILGDSLEKDMTSFLTLCIT